MEEDLTMEYDIRTVFNNFQIFEQRVKNNEIDLNSNNLENFKAKYLLAQGLQEYWGALLKIPYIADNIDEMVEKILSNIENVRMEDGKIAWKLEDFDLVTGAKIESFRWWLPIYLTPIIMREDITSNNSYKGLYIERNKYLIHKTIELMNNENVDPNYRYEKMIKLFGEEDMLKLGNESIENMKKEKNISNDFFEAFNVMNDSDEDPYVREFAEKRINRTLNRDERHKNPKVVATIDYFEKLINNAKIIPKEFKDEMIKRANEYIIEVYPDERLASEGVNGLYSTFFGHIVYDSNFSGNDKEMIILHEVIHAATTHANLNCGLKDKKGNGIGLNEGVTEYLAQKILEQNGKNIKSTSYKRNVSIAKDLFDLYGERLIIDAMLNGESILEQAMEKDGKSYTEFRDITDSLHRALYNKGENIENVQKISDKIDSFISGIKENRGLEDTRSEYKKEMENLQLPWYKKMITKIKSWFRKKDNVLLLNSQDETISELSETRKKEFLSSIKIDSVQLISKGKAKQKQINKDEIDR